MESLDASAVSKLLVEIGRRLELSGDSPFKARAYYNAADSLSALPAPLGEVIAAGKLRDVPGVGEAIAEKIVKLHKTGTHPTLEFLREQMPAGVLEMLAVPKLGPKKAALIYSELKISSLNELAAACKAGRLRDCKGLGAKTEAAILKGIEFIRKQSGQRRIHEATEYIQSCCERLRQAQPQLRAVTPAGSLRRACEVVGDLCVVAAAADGDARPTDASAPDVRLVVSDEAHFGAALLMATGSSTHTDALRALAVEKGLTLSEKGLRRGDCDLPCASEAEIYAALGLAYIEPELREGRGEIERARARTLPKLTSKKDIRGILHSHTTFSDGAQSLEAMAVAVREGGYQYYGVADHSQSAAYARGLKEERVRAQHKLADELNAGYGGKFRIFKGIESDILDDGSLDYPDEVLARFDFIVASVHSLFTLDKDKQTARIVKAVSHPRTTILGHPTGRLLLQREGYAMDLDAVLQACAEHGVAVEINAHPYRLDLDWRWHQRALELGCMLSINPDAHSIADLDLVHWGVLQARKGGVPPERVLNCMDLDAIAEYFYSRHRRTAGVSPVFGAHDRRDAGGTEGS